MLSCLWPFHLAKNLGMGSLDLSKRPPPRSFLTDLDVSASIHNSFVCNVHTYTVLEDLNLYGVIVKILQRVKKRKHAHGILSTDSRTVHVWFLLLPTFKQSSCVCAWLYMSPETC